VIAPEIRWRYRPGHRFECPNCKTHIWVDQGKKSPNDIRIMVKTPQWGTAICLPCVALQVDMVFDAEDIAQEREKYKDMRTFRGWVKFRDFLKDMRLMGPKLALVKYRGENAQTEIPLFIEVDEDGNP
jgi:hypothetical protein